MELQAHLLKKDKEIDKLSLLKTIFEEEYK